MNLAREGLSQMCLVKFDVIPRNNVKCRVSIVIVISAYNRNSPPWDLVDRNSSSYRFVSRARMRDHQVCTCFRSIISSLRSHLAISLSRYHFYELLECSEFYIESRKPLSPWWFLIAGSKTDVSWFKYLSWSRVVYHLKAFEFLKQLCRDRWLKKSKSIN